MVEIGKDNGKAWCVHINYNDTNRVNQGYEQYEEYWGQITE